MREAAPPLGATTSQNTTFSLSRSTLSFSPSLDFSFPPPPPPPPPAHLKSPLTAFFCVSVAVIPALLLDRNACAISDSSTVSTVHSTK